MTWRGIAAILTLTAIDIAHATYSRLRAAFPCMEGPSMIEAPEPQTTIEVFVSWGGAVLVLFGIIGGVAGFAAWLGKRMDKRIAVIAEQLDARTQNIQPGFRNHGSSMTDIAHQITDLRRDNEATHGVLVVKVDAVTERLADHLRYHRDRRSRDDGPPEGHTDRRKAQG